VSAAHTKVSTRQLQVLADAVERLEWLTQASHTTRSIDPASMLDALGDVYNASQGLVHGSARPLRR
jgi:hypothetical protein